MKNKRRLNIRRLQAVALRKVRHNKEAVDCGQANANNSGRTRNVHVDSSVNLIAILFRFGPHTSDTIRVDADMNQAGTTANGAVLHVILITACRQVDWHNNVLAAIVANVTGFFVHYSWSYY